MTETPIYLDFNATTPPADEVIEAMTAALRESWGNPSSGHAIGQRARAVVENARSRVAALLCCEPGEIVFTSGGTESDNAAIVGVAEAAAERGRHLVTTAIEHPAVEQACRYLESRGFAISRVGVDANGRVAVADVASALRPETTLVSVMHANNETGVIQPVREIADRCRDRGIVVHTDAAQSVGKVPTSVDSLGVDLLTVAGHKMYGPKGVGALYIRSGTPFASFLRGAPHEGGRRAGTESVSDIAGLGAACRLASNEIDAREAKLRALRDRLESGLVARIGDAVVHGQNVDRLPNTLSISIPGIVGNLLLDRLEGVAASAGQACHSGRPEPSAVLLAMGVDAALAVCTLRLTVGRTNTEEEIDRAIERIAGAVSDLRRSR